MNIRPQKLEDRGCLQHDISFPEQDRALLHMDEKRIFAGLWIAQFALPRQCITAASKIDDDLLSSRGSLKKQSNDDLDSLEAQPIASVGKSRALHGLFDKVTKVRWLAGMIQTLDTTLGNDIVIVVLGKLLNDVPLYQHAGKGGAHQPSYRD